MSKVVNSRSTYKLSDARIFSTCRQCPGATLRNRFIRAEVEKIHGREERRERRAAYKRVSFSAAPETVPAIDSRLVNAVTRQSASNFPAAQNSVVSFCGMNVRVRQFQQPFSHSHTIARLTQALPGLEGCGGIHSGISPTRSASAEQLRRRIR